MGGGGGLHLGHAHHHGHAQHEEREERQQRAVAPRHQVLERGAPLGQLQQLLEAATSGDIEQETQVTDYFKISMIGSFKLCKGLLPALMRPLLLASPLGLPVLAAARGHGPDVAEHLLAVRPRPRAVLQLRPGLGHLHIG